MLMNQIIISFLIRKLSLFLSPGLLTAIYVTILFLNIIAAVMPVWSYV